MKKVVGNGIRGKMRRMEENIAECARSAVMLDGEMSKYYADIYQGLAQGCTLSPNFSKYILMTC